MAASRERGESEAAAWVAGVSGARRPAPARALRVDQGGAVQPRAACGRASGAQAAPATDLLTVGEVAAGVDAGRDLAAAAAADGFAVIIASGPRGHGEAARALLRALAADRSRPLRALRTHGTYELAILCGIALGAGERGLGFASDGLAALAGAAVAAAVEPPLRPRLLALTDHDEATRNAIATARASELEAALD